MKYRVNYKEIRSGAEDMWFDILGGLAPSLTSAIENHPHHVACPVHGGTDGFRLFKDAEDTGGGICNTCGPFPNGFKILSWVNKWSEHEAFSQVGTYLGLIEEDEFYEKQTSVPVEEKTFIRATRKLERIYDETMPITSKSAIPPREYLRKRGLKDCLSDSPLILGITLRFHPSLPYYDPIGKDNYTKLGAYPAMLALVCDLERRWVSIHRTYLTHDGTKAPVPNPKKLMCPIEDGATNGAAIQLYQAGDELAIAEGIETALAVHLATGLPTWATVSAGGMRTLQVPESVQTLYIMADLDRSDTGVEAANKLATRLVNEGRDARVVIPPGKLPARARSIDWLDIYNNSKARTDG